MFSGRTALFEFFDGMNLVWIVPRDSGISICPAREAIDTSGADVFPRVMVWAHPWGPTGQTMPVVVKKNNVESETIFLERAWALIDDSMDGTP